jgi:hypothetical protein
MAQGYSFEKKRLKKAMEIGGPTGVLGQVEEDYEILFLIVGLHGGTLKIMAHGVASLEKY